MDFRYAYHEFIPNRVSAIKDSLEQFPGTSWYTDICVTSWHLFFVSSYPCTPTIAWNYMAHVHREANIGWTVVNRLRSYGTYQKYVMTCCHRKCRKDGQEMVICIRHSRWTVLRDLNHINSIINQRWGGTPTNISYYAIIDHRRPTFVWSMYRNGCRFLNVTITGRILRLENDPRVQRWTRLSCGCIGFKMIVDGPHSDVVLANIGRQPGAKRI